MADLQLTERPPEQFPWPPSEEAPLLEGLFGGFARSWVGSVFRPSELFRSLPPDPGIGWPLLYYLIVGVLASGADLFWRSLFGAAFGAADVPGLPWPETADTVPPVVNFLFSPIVLVFLIFVATSIIHILLMMAGGARQGLWTTFAVLCFAYSPQLFSVVPLVGGMIGFVWMIAVAIIGLRTAHGTETWRAAVAVLAPLVILLGFLVLVFFLALALGLGDALLR